MNFASSKKLVLTQVQTVVLSMVSNSSYIELYIYIYIYLILYIERIIYILVFFFSVNSTVTLISS